MQYTKSPLREQTTTTTTTTTITTTAKLIYTPPPQLRSSNPHHHYHHHYHSTSNSSYLPTPPPPLPLPLPPQRYNSDPTRPKEPPLDSIFLPSKQGHKTECKGDVSIISHIHSFHSLSIFLSITNITRTKWHRKYKYKI